MAIVDRSTKAPDRHRDETANGRDFDSSACSCSRPSAYSGRDLRSIPELVTAPGEVALDLKQVAKITSRIAGQVEQIHVQLGDRVKRGQRLVAIGSLQLDQMIEEYLVGKAQADVAENSFRRTEKLRTDDIVTERKLNEDRGQYLETKARYQHIREKLMNMGLSTAELQATRSGTT